MLGYSEPIEAIDHTVKYGEQLSLEWQPYDQNFDAIVDYLVKLRAEGKIEIVTVEDTIARIRSWTDKPDFPIIFISDPIEKDST